MSRRPLLLCGLALSVGLAATAWAQQDPPPPPQDPPPPSEEFAPPVESDEPIAEGEEGEGQPDLRRPLPPIPGRGEGDYGRPDPRRGPGPGGNRPGSRQYPDAPGAYSQPGAGGRAPGMPGRARIEQDPEMAALQEKDNQLERETMGSSAAPRVRISGPNCGSKSPHWLPSTLPFARNDASWKSSGSRLNWSGFAKHCGSAPTTKMPSSRGGFPN